ncbi:hypothetical protein V6N13_125092 [Hibiscus sabdariffa]
MPQRQNNIIIGNNLNIMPQRNQNNFYGVPMNNQESLAEYKEKNGIAIQNLEASVQNLKIQIGQIASAFNNRPRESPAKPAVQIKGEEPVDEISVEPVKDEAERSNADKKTMPMNSSGTVVAIVGTPPSPLKLPLPSLAAIAIKEGFCKH